MLLKCLEDIMKRNHCLILGSHGFSNFKNSLTHQCYTCNQELVAESPVNLWNSLLR